jgi:RNA polymerase sigma-70 factor, ECF subfamily
MTNNELEVCIEGCRSGDRKAQLQLYKTFFGQLLQMALRYTNQREDAKGYVNQAFLKILNNIHQYDASGSFEGWCKRIMTRTLIDIWRQKKLYTQNIVVDERLIDIDETTYNEAERYFDEEGVRQLLQRLPEATRHVFSLFALEGYAHSEIAALLGISEGTSRWHVNDARRQLKGWIEQTLQKP